MPTMQLTDAQLALLPTDDEVARFQQLGYYVSKTLFSDEYMDQVLEASERFYRAELDEPPVAVPDKFRPTGSYGPGLRKHDQSSMFNTTLRSLVTHPLLGAIS